MENEDSDEDFDDEDDELLEAREYDYVEELKGKD